MHQGVGPHLPLHRRRRVHLRQQVADPADVAQLIGDDHPASARKRRHRAGARKHGRDGLGDLLRLQVLQGKHHRHHLARRGVARPIQPPEYLERHLSQLLQRHQPQIAPCLDQDHPLGGQDQVQCLQRLAVRIRLGIDKLQRPFDLQIPQQRLVRHLRESCHHVRVRYAVELEADVARWSG